jgi:thiamine monophosphate synthase
VGLEALSRVRNIVGGFPLVAIGGITSAKVSSVLEAGADSAAIISGLVADSDSISRNLKAILKQLSDQS